MWFNWRTINEAEEASNGKPALDKSRFGNVVILFGLVCLVLPNTR